MKTNTEKKEYTVDAKNRSLGRVATEVAQILRGKDQTDFSLHLAPKLKVTIINASKMAVTPKKLKEKIYTHYTGHPGGLRRTPLDRLVTKKGWAEPLRKAVYGMLPSNRLRAVIMKNLTITD